MDREKLKKRAQKLLAEAQEKLSAASKLAEEGRFNLEFNGSSYYPKSVHLDEEGEERSYDELDELSEELGDELYRPEYSDIGEWWSPSYC